MPIDYTETDPSMMGLEECRAYERQQEAMVDAKSNNATAPGGADNTLDSGKTLKERVTSAGTWLMKNTSAFGAASTSLDMLGFDKAANAIDTLSEKAVDLAYETSIIGMLDNTVSSVKDTISDIRNIGLAKDAKKNAKNSTGINEEETAMYTVTEMKDVIPNRVAADWSSNPSAITSKSDSPRILSGIKKYLFPGSGLAVDKSTLDSSASSTLNSINLYRAYSPRLFGAPPQLTSLNDIRTIHLVLLVISICLVFYWMLKHVNLLLVKHCLPAVCKQYLAQYH